VVNNSCYLISYDTMPQAQAKEWCRNAGGYLAAVTSREETDALRLHFDSRDLWIDGTDVVTEGEWLLQTGERLIYVGFVAPQPDEGTNGNCLFIENDHVGDTRCTRSNGILCEQDIND